MFMWLFCLLLLHVCGCKCVFVRQCLVCDDFRSLATPENCADCVLVLCCCLCGHVLFSVSDFGTFKCGVMYVAFMRVLCEIKFLG